MGEIIFQNMITANGYFEGPNREIDWHNVDDEFNEYAGDFLDSLDTLLFGRITYELMANYWPGEIATTDDPVIAGKMNNLQKVVVSRTLKKVEWQNSRLIDNNVVEEIRKMKSESAKDIAVFGSSDLSLTLIDHGLIDEFRIFINPVILGNGRPLLGGLKPRVKLKLIKTRTFNSGNVLLHYRTAD